MAAGRKIVAVDLFCGAGGLTKGFAMAGIDVRLGIDADPRLKLLARVCEVSFFKETQAAIVVTLGCWVELARGGLLAPSWSYRMK